ncbi:phosphatase PAP2 family protein [Candidatus Saccharibacteria bacterium]|jgi:undecaprenyl-diphosphatase|nr:phosphatase PAP2 family protein [Candidatus Saccharibacteria bacterium]
MQTFIVAVADWLVFPIALLAAAVLLWRVPNKHKIVVYSRLLMAGLTSYLVAKLMALAYQPSSLRPFEIAGVEPGASYLDNPGFPSDHALFVWVIVFAVVYVLGRTWLTLFLAVAAAVVSVGRVLALVHAPIDVVGGFLAAIIGAAWYVTSYAKLDKKNLQKVEK